MITNIRHFNLVKTLNFLFLTAVMLFLKSNLSFAQPWVPTVPTALSANAVSASQINLTWNPSTDNVGVTGYHIFRGGVNIATSTTTSYSNIGLTANTTYSYQVRAFDGAGNVSGLSSAASATTLNGSDSIAPSDPTNLAATAVATNQINLTWDVSTDNVDVAGYYIFRGGINVATATTNSHSDLGLTANTSYSYQVKAFDAAGNLSGFSNTANATTLSAADTTAPSNPSSLSANAVSSSQINLTWNVSTDNVAVTGYTIFRGGVNVATSVTNSYSDAGLTANTSYSYQVKAFDAAGNLSGFSNTANTTTFTSGADESAPSNPGNLSANAVSSNQIDLTWDASTDNVAVAGYYIFRGGINVATAITNSYSNTGLTANTTYSYQVKAFDAAGNLSGFSNTANATTLSAADTTAPSNPSSLSANAVSTSQINLTWAVSTDNVAVTGYTIFRGGVNIATSTTNSYSNIGLTANTTYSYQVKAFDAAGNLSDFSNTANATTLSAADTTAPSNPSSLSANAVSSSQINLTWTASTDNVAVTGYNIFRGGVNIATSTTNSYSNIGLTANTMYSYQVKAFDAAGNLSGFSNTATTTTLASGPVQPTLLWTFNLDSSKGSPTLKKVDDVNGDGKNDIIVGQSVSNTFMLNTTTSTSFWSELTYRFMDSIDDITGDAKKDLILTKLVSVSLQDSYVAAINSTNGVRPWVKVLAGIPVSAKSVGDLNGNGRSEIAVAISRNPAPFIYVAKNNDGNSYWQYNIDYIGSTISNMEPVFDQSVNSTLLVVSGADQNGILYLIGVDSSGVESWSVTPALGSLVTTLKRGASSARDMLLKKANQFYRVQGTGNNIIWQYDNCYELFSVQSFPDFNGDGQDDVLAFAVPEISCGGSAEIKIINGSTGVDLVSYDIGSPSLLLAATNGDVSGDGKTDILAGEEGNVYVIDSSNGNIMQIMNTTGMPLELIGLDSIGSANSLPDWAVSIRETNGSMNVKAYEF